MHCEMCGKEAGIFLTRVEGTMLKLCKQCSKYGKVFKPLHIDTKPIDKPKSKFTKLHEEEVEERVVLDYAQKIKNAREKLAMKQEDFAKKINEKESLVHNIETGHIEPSIELARKISRFLGINLIEEVKLKGQLFTKNNSASDTLTLGDVIKVKKRH